jgi:hypothetical protein
MLLDFRLPPKSIDLQPRTSAEQLVRPQGAGQFNEAARAYRHLLLSIPDLESQTRGART